MLGTEPAYADYGAALAGDAHAVLPQVYYVDNGDEIQLMAWACAVGSMGEGTAGAVQVSAWALRNDPVLGASVINDVKTGYTDGTTNLLIKAEANVNAAKYVEEGDVGVHVSRADAFAQARFYDENGQEIDRITHDPFLDETVYEVRLEEGGGGGDGEGEGMKTEGLLAPEEISQ